METGLHSALYPMLSLRTLHRNEKFLAEKAERDAQRKAIMRETAGEPYNKEVRLPAVVVLKLRLRRVCDMLVSRSTLSCAIGQRG